MLGRMVEGPSEMMNGVGFGPMVVAGKGISPRKTPAKGKSGMSREDAVGLPVAIEGVHWRREEAPPHSKSGSAVTRCLILTDPSCITFSRRNYLEDHFRIVHQMFPSKPRVGRKKTSNKPSRCISPTARERMADHMQGDFPFKFWKAKKKRFVMSTTKAKHMWCSVDGHAKESEEIRREWVRSKAAEFYRIWREGQLAVDTMVNLASHVEDYWNGKGILDEDEVAQKGRIPRKYEEFMSDEEAPTWETNKDGREVCRRRLKSKAIEGKPIEGAAGNVCMAIRADGERAESASEDEKEESASTVEDLPSSLMEVSSNLGPQGIVAVGHSGRPGLLHDSELATEDQLHRGPISQDCSMHGITSGRSPTHQVVHGSFTSLMNGVTPGDCPENHLMAMSSQAMDGAHHPSLHDHREYERQQLAARV